MREAPMIISVKKRFELHHSRWSGGITTQLAIWPADADYASRNFRWRISSAVVEEESSVFTHLPGVRRCLMTLSGELSLMHDGTENIQMRPLRDVFRFDGGKETTSVGRCVDFNLMLCGGFRGDIGPLHAPDALQLPAAGSDLLWYGIFFAADAEVSVRYKGYRVDLSRDKGDFVLITYRPLLCGAVTLSLSSEEEVPAVFASVWHEKE
ncbi:MAG: HutD family protein [Synergistes sp.]|nr:HutD family protein [Synergistes sp.]